MKISEGVTGEDNLSIMLYFTNKSNDIMQSGL